MTRLTSAVTFCFMFLYLCRILKLTIVSVFHHHVKSVNIWHKFPKLNPHCAVESKHWRTYLRFILFLFLEACMYFVFRVHAFWICCGTSSLLRLLRLASSDTWSATATKTLWTATCGRAWPMWVMCVSGLSFRGLIFHQSFFFLCNCECWMWLISVKCASDLQLTWSGWRSPETHRILL